MYLLFFITRRDIDAGGDVITLFCLNPTLPNPKIDNDKKNSKTSTTSHMIMLFGQLILFYTLSKLVFAIDMNDMKGTILENMFSPHLKMVKLAVSSRIPD